MLEELFDDLRLVNNADDAHSPLAHRAGQGVCFVDFSDEVRPALFLRFRNTRPMGSLLTFLVVGVSIGGVAGLSLWVWLGRQTESESFRAEVRSGFVSDAGPINFLQVFQQNQYVNDPLSCYLRATRGHPLAGRSPISRQVKKHRRFL